jgi:hypothetical protein
VGIAVTILALFDAVFASDRVSPLPASYGAPVVLLCSGEK